MELEIAFAGVVVGYILGFVARAFFCEAREEKPQAAQIGLTVGTPELKDNSVVSKNGPHGVYVRFQFADGQTVVRKVDPTTLDLKLLFRGRTFEAGEWTADGHIYREIVK